MINQIKMNENDYNFLQKQTYKERELHEQLILIKKDDTCICKKYNMPNWTDITYTNIINILNYIYPNYITSEKNMYSVIYNNIIIQITSDSDITQSNIIFRYMESQININDLNLIKNTFFIAF
jgi:hypothetical protein